MASQLPTAFNRYRSTVIQCHSGSVLIRPIRNGEQYYVTGTGHRAETASARDVHYVVRGYVQALGGLVPHMPGPLPRDYESAQQTVNRLLEADDFADNPRTWIDWMSRKNEVGPLERIQFGAGIHTSDAEIILEAAREAGLQVNAYEASARETWAFWDEVDRNLAIIEANALAVLRAAGLQVSDEGHDDETRIASVWITTEEEDRKQALVKAIIDWAEGDWPSTTSGSMDYAFGADTMTRLYQNTSDVARFIDVTIEFFGIEPLIAWSALQALAAPE